jgi:FtsH-binding integral membrane protein
MAFEDFQNRDTSRHAQATTTDVLFDAGLRRHMIGIFNYMFAGLALSGGAAFLLLQTGAASLFFSGPGQFTPLGWVAAVPVRSTRRITPIPTPAPAI